MYKLLLCTRYLRTRYIALASIISVTLGVATMIVVNSVMAGFGSEMRDRIKGILADIVVETNTLDGVNDYLRHKALIEKVAGEYISAMTPTVEIYGMLSFQYGGQWVTRPVTLIGIEPQGKASVGPLVDYLQSYQPERQNGRVIRTAERGREVPPGWELTESAADYRREWAERQRWFMEQLRDEQLQHKGLNGPEAEAAADAEPVDPFQMSDGSDIASAPVADPGELLPGRIYIGQGLVSYLYEDQDTGEPRTMMMARPGDDVKLSTVTAGRPPNATHFHATIVDVFKSGMSEYDSSLVFCNLEYLQKIRGMIDPTSGDRAITSIQIRLKDFRDAEEVVERLRAAFPPGMYSVKTWEQKQGPLLAAVEVESAILNVLLFLIIAVAGFGILAIFFMIVVEKTRDIGILKALGASSRGVMSIFLSYGLSLGIVGSGAGMIAGLLFVAYINEIEAAITWLTGHKVFDERIYYFPSIPTHVNVAMVVWVSLGAILIAVLASILPARRAAALQPVQALRYE
ncbi:MAG: ABC transporter permease [Planctomycetales bacterium 12-60-4]|nr:MAG: ABC transporter permease [Planctomycetales bacterium 12-60-4]